MQLRFNSSAPRARDDLSSLAPWENKAGKEQSPPYVKTSGHGSKSKNILAASPYFQIPFTSSSLRS